MSVAPPKYLPVLFGHGYFEKDANGNNVWLDDGLPQYIIPKTDDFLELTPTHGTHQYWPFPADDTDSPKNLAVVFLCVTTNTDCRHPDVITELGYTIFDTDAIYTGSTGRRARGRVQTCVPPGVRGENLVRFAMSDHYIINETADHHPGTCKSSLHKAQPYHFTYCKSKHISRKHIANTIEAIYTKACCAGISPANAKKGRRRAVVLVGWGDNSYHKDVQAAHWFKEKKFFQHWDIRQYHVLTKYCKQPDSFRNCLEQFGIQFHADGKDVSNNAGNKSAFTIQLLIAMSFLTAGQLEQLDKGQRLEPNPRFPGVESVLARDNRPPGAGPLPIGWVPIDH